MFAITLHRSVAQSWGYAVAACRHVGAGLHRLHVVTVRWRDGRLAAIWPLCIRREGGLRIASHISWGSDEEYAGPLIAPGPWAGDVARMTFDGVRGAADVRKVFNIHPENPICERLEGLRGRSRDATPAHIAGTSAHRDMASWVNLENPQVPAQLGAVASQVGGAGSPGAALHAFAAETAIARGLDLDFRFGGGAYEAWWSDRVETRWNHAAPLTPLGYAGVAAIWGAAAGRDLRRRIGPPIKRLLCA